MKLNTPKMRVILLGVFVWLIIAAYLLRLADVQIVLGEKYLQQQQRGTVKTQVIKAARGEIVDRNGNPFSYNRASYEVVFDAALAPTGHENSTIAKLLEIMKKNGESWIDELPLYLDGGKPRFTDDEAAVSRLKKHLETNSYTEAEDVFYWLCVRYDLQGLDAETAREIAGVRYEMERHGYSISVRYVFAEDISLNTAVLIRQMSNELPGVQVQENARRSYIDGGLAPHIVGRIGPIFADELEGYLSQNRGYTREDYVGKEGIERAFESTLRGEDGSREIELDSSYRVVDIAEAKAPVPGNTVVLTLDKNIQRTAIDALIAEIKYLNETAPEGRGKEADAGAVVAIDIKNSEVLAAVTYPSYDLESYSADYAKNSSDSLYPLLNRAFSGVYAPGSCFKPVVGLGGLSEGIINPATTVNCQGVYTFLNSYQPTCLSWHGAMTVSGALMHSCNIFFYDTGRQLGIDKINDYARQLGLGVPTGIELSESSGTQNDPNTERPGDVLQAAIGQLDNGYTPVQLANYCATIARRGKRYELSLVKAISSYYDWQQSVVTHEPVLANDMGLAAEVFDPIFDGMIKAVHDPGGTAYSYLGDYPLTVAAKTGTPQTAQFPNSTFICFAPAEDPQIAIAVVIEKGWHGYTGAPVARAVLDAYFFPPEQQEETPEEGESAEGEETPVEQQGVETDETQSGDVPEVPQTPALQLPDSNVAAFTPVTPFTGQTQTSQAPQQPETENEKPSPTRRRGSDAIGVAERVVSEEIIASRSD